MVKDQIYPVYQRRPLRYVYSHISTRFRSITLQDINFPEKFLEELECLENITSCNKVKYCILKLLNKSLVKVENYLLFSEFEQNLGDVLSPRRSDGEGQERPTRAKTGRDRLKSSWQVPLPKRRVSIIVEHSV